MAWTNGAGRFAACCVVVLGYVASVIARINQRFDNIDARFDNVDANLAASRQGIALLAEPLRVLLDRQTPPT